ncbi:dynein light chain Tctex-type 5-like [Wyeomyia smithii]|uniref:dynein light chain Tctex-type 5-like n=1 Tax=Wyeomyia smithii TaxID=174621 RepID=UPI0024680E74|nr:dynein light chain Tctex-type 5-like [Wyeomyia smithii]XP_055535061.1 dynein light chain Tctex-type 5-like [Wyeomyia smithii]
MEVQPSAGAAAPATTTSVATAGATTVPAVALAGSTGPPLRKPAPNVSSKTGRFFGSAFNITNRYRANSSNLGKVSLAITNLKVIHNVPLPPPICAMVSSDTPPLLKYQPTYQLESKNPFNREACEDILRESLDKSLQGVEYNSYFASSLCQQICEDVKAKVKELNFDRYKIVVTVTMGERYMQGLKVVSECLWDPKRDNNASCIYDSSPSLFAVASIYAIYFD